MRCAILRFLPGRITFQSINGCDVANIIEKMINARIDHHAKATEGAGMRDMNDRINRDYMEARKTELAEALDSFVQEG
jgi:hypothetical protein